MVDNDENWPYSYRLQLEVAVRTTSIQLWNKSSMTFIFECDPLDPLVPYEHDNA